MKHFLTLASDLPVTDGELRLFTEAPAATEAAARGDVLWAWIVAGAVILAIIAVLTRSGLRLRPGGVSPEERALRTLTRGARVRGRELMLLRRLAESLSAPAAALALCEGAYDRAVEAAERSAREGGEPVDRAAVLALRCRLFSAT